MSRYILAADASGMNYIALDRSIGGYPYSVASVYDAEQFDTRQDAAKYVRVFASSRGHGIGQWPWIPVKVDLITTEVERFNPIELGDKLDPNTAAGKFTKMLEAVDIPFSVEFITDTIKISYVVSDTDCEFFFNRTTGDLMTVGVA